MRTRPRLSGPARFAIVTWLIALATAAAIMLAAMAKARASEFLPLPGVSGGPATILVVPPSGYVLAGLIMSASALALSVLAVILATRPHPRGGI